MSIENFKVGDTVKVIKDDLKLNHSHFEIGESFIVQEIVDAFDVGTGVYLRSIKGKGTGIHSSLCEKISLDIASHDFKIGEIIKYIGVDDINSYHYILNIEGNILKLLTYSHGSTFRFQSKYFNKITFNSIPQPVVDYFHSIGKGITNMEKLSPQVNTINNTLDTNTNILMSTTLDKITIEKFYSNEKNVEAVTITKEELEYYYESLETLVNLFTSYKTKVNRMQLDFNNAISSDNIKEIKSLIKTVGSRLDSLQSFLEDKTIAELLPVEENKTDEDPKVFWNN